MTYTTILKQMAALSMTVSLAACLDGGGGSSNPDGGNAGTGNTGGGGSAGPASFANRVTRVDYDYDNNSVIDATDTISYDASGRVNLTTYLYTDDGTLDILNLRDSGTTQETNAFTYDSDGNVILFVVDRQFQRIEASMTYDTAGLLTRQDFQFLNSSGGQISATYWDFSYTGQQLDQVDSFFGSNTTPATTQSFSYASSGLPTTSRITGGSLDATTTFSWRSDGQLDSVDTQSDNGDSSSVVIGYDTQNLQQTQTWTNVGQGFNYSEITGQSYTRSVTYDAQSRPLVVSYDLDSDGSVDATVTFTWETAACIPATLWAPNAFPNFVRDTAQPFIPGTGFFTSQFCAP